MEIRLTESLEVRLKASVPGQSASWLQHSRHPQRAWAWALAGVCCTSTHFPVPTAIGHRVKACCHCALNTSQSAA
jgi:hypothetical protein